MEVLPRDLMTKMIKVTTVDHDPTLVALHEVLHAPPLDHLVLQIKNRDMAISIFSMHYREVNHPDLVGDRHLSNHIILGLVMDIFLEVRVFRVAIREIVAYMVGGTWGITIHRLGGVEVGAVLLQ
jgi:hypothetical protein